MLGVSWRRALAVGRAAGRLLVVGVLGLFYLAGACAGAVIVAVLTATAAVRLGWADARKRGQHGAA